MVSEFVTGKGAALIGAKLAEAKALVNDEVTPKKHGNNYKKVNEKTALTRAIGNIITGNRVFVPLDNVNTKELYNMAFMRMPVVSVLYSSSFESGAKTHNPFFSLLDSGCILMSVENNQELLDTVVQSYIIAEDSKILLPVVIQYDMPETMEGVNIPGDKTVINMIPKLNIPQKIDIKKPITTSYVDEGYAELKMQQLKAMENVVETAKTVWEKWGQKFKRQYTTIEEHQTEDAKNILIIMGSHFSTAKKVVDDLREEGKKVGVLRIRMLRPFPKEDITEHIENKKIGVADSGITSNGGILQKEIGKPCPNFIIAAHPSEKDFREMFDKIEGGSAETHWVV
jgi:pyruvate ferredoxin oxidoreductase alpha subunit